MKKKVQSRGKPNEGVRGKQSVKIDQSLWKQIVCLSQKNQISRTSTLEEIVIMGLIAYRRRELPRVGA